MRSSGAVAVVAVAAVVAVVAAVAAVESSWDSARASSSAPSRACGSRRNRRRVRGPRVRARNDEVAEVEAAESPTPTPAPTPMPTPMVLEAMRSLMVGRSVGRSPNEGMPMREEVNPINRLRSRGRTDSAAGSLVVHAWRDATQCDRSCCGGGGGGRGRSADTSGHSAFRPNARFGVSGHPHRVSATNETLDKHGTTASSGRACGNKHTCFVSFCHGRGRIVGVGGPRTA